MNPKLAKLIGDKTTNALASPPGNEHSRSTIIWSDVKTWWTLLNDTFQKWSGDKAPRLGAALSYYTVFSLWLHARRRAS